MPSRETAVERLKGGQCLSLETRPAMPWRTVETRRYATRLPSATLHNFLIRWLSATILITPLQHKENTMYWFGIRQEGQKSGHV